MLDSLFVSQNVPNELVSRYNISQAANNFCNRINSLGHFSRHIAVPPGNVGSSFNNFVDENNTEYHLCRFLPHKGIGRLFNCICDNIWLFLKIAFSKERNIWFYNVWTGNLLAYLLSLLLVTKHIHVLLADYNPSRYNRFIQKLILFGLKKSKGVLSLSARCSHVNERFISIAGIINYDDIVNNSPFMNNKSFLISGTLNRNTGLDLALTIFSMIPQATLYISGSLNTYYKEIVDKACSLHNNIIYKGFFDRYEDYLSFLQNVDYVLSFRNPNSEVNLYNFPSKILETLAKGKIVISTMEYPELEDINYMLAPYNEIELVEFINNLINNSNEKDLDAYRNNSLILKKQFTEDAWLKAFCQLENRL